MILKDSDQSTIVQDGDLIIKTFKENYDFFPTEEWKNTCNQFSELYGHFPKIIECDINKIIMEKVNGETIDTSMKRRFGFMSYKEQIAFVKKTQYMYFKFISNLLEYNLNHNVLLVHTDLNCENMIIDDDKIVCVDLNSVTLNRTPIEHYFITFGADEWARRIDILAHRYITEMADEAATINERHRHVINELNKESADLNRHHREVITKLEERLGKNK